MMRNYTPFNQIDSNQIQFSLGQDRQGRPMIGMTVGAAASDVAIVSPACVTNWPRVHGDGNYGTMWGPTELAKAKYTLDLTDAAINGTANSFFADFTQLMNTIDDKLLDFVTEHQLRVLGRKNLGRDEVKMLQIRSVKPKYDKTSGQLLGHALQCSTAKFQSDGVGGRFSRQINVCDHTGKVVSGGVVHPGDIVAATIYANQIYCGVGGDKFGIQWSFEDVQVICQRSRLAQKTEVSAFGCAQYDFAQPYTDDMCTHFPGPDEAVQLNVAQA